ncbi:MAG: tetratricopeptide repeat protein [Deltaproteobacteria bacterium]|nr:tetratricopeptide repeat protein [Deltaproteobacteria bacterium]
MQKKQGINNTEKVNDIFKLISSIRERIHKGSLDITMKELIKVLKLYCSTLLLRKEKELLEDEIYDLEIKLSKHPKFIATYGPVSFVKGQHEMAIDFLSQLTGLEEESVQEKLTRFQGFLENNQPDKAALLAQEIMFAPNVKLEDIIAVGDCYLRKKFPQEAQEAYELANKKYSESIHALNRLAISLRKDGRFEEALNYYRQAIRLAPHDEGLYYNTARLYIEWGKREKAIEALKKALNINPEFKDANVLLAKIQKSGKDIKV